MDTAEKVLLLCFLLEGVCCREFSISLPEKIQALSGSCVIIKCRFEIEEQYDKDLSDTAIGVWLINGTSIKGKITGQLKDKDCTTVFTDIRSADNGQYYFRIEGKGGLKYTYKQFVTIEVIESPERPLVRVSVDQKDLKVDQEVLEGSSVSLRCSAETLCSSRPPTLTWSSTPRIPLSESSRRQELISDLNFTAAHRHHTLTFTCTVTYQIQERNATAHSSFTLHVQYAPKISSSSGCTIGNVTVCFCEADGNPSPKMEWHLSGRPVSNYSHMSISEERLNSTGLRSFISLHQSLTNTSTLECVANNTHGSAQQLFFFYLVYQQMNSSKQNVLEIYSLLVGIAVGTSFMAILWVTTVLYKRIHKTQRGDKTGLIRTDAADSRDKREEPFYANKVMMSSTEAPTQTLPETLHYSSINFLNTKPESKDIRGVSSLTDEYAVLQYRGRDVADSEEKVRKFSSMPVEDAVYQGTHKAKN